MRASYLAVPSGRTVRLAKPTSNLFRTRSRTEVPGLDVSGLAGVISIDPVARVADVQGMCTYEHLVAATLPHGLIPLVVPQLRTITLGGAVAGLGIEATSFRSGLPHESVLEMDVFIGTGEVVTTRPGDDLFNVFPNSYGSLGYATRLRISLEPVGSQVALRHLHLADTALLATTIAEIIHTRKWCGERVDALDGVAFAPGEYVLTLARWSDADAGAVSDYTGKHIYYRSLQQRDTDLLTMHDYLWRWDTDWFWCSRAFGAQHPCVRPWWPRRWRRSDVYHRLIALDRRFGVVDRLDAQAGRPARERVIQDVEIPLARLGEFLDWFDSEIGMRPVWLCPVVSTQRWATYPLEPGRAYVNVGFWGTVHVGADAGQAPRNRAIEVAVHALGGHKSLYSDSYYDPDTFDRLYAGPHLAAAKARYDPNGRFPTLYDKAVGRR